MLKTLTFGLVLIAAAFTARSYVQDATAETNFPCREGHRPYSAQEIVRMIGCAVDRYGGDAGQTEAVGRCESGLNEHAVSASGTYRGVFQYGPLWNSAADRYWRPRWGGRHLNIPSVFNARAQVMVTVRYVRANGWSAWSCT
jgi:hypothetical protein